MNRRPPPMPEAPSIRVMLVDDHAILRAGLVNLLNIEPGLEVVAVADDGESALTLWSQHRPDVTLLDINLGGMDGIETVRRLRAEFPDARVLMLTSSEAEEDIRHALDAGASGYVTKNLRRAELFASIRQVHAGGQALGADVARLLAAGSGEGLVTRREMEVLGLVRQGFTNAEVGRLLGIAERTAKAHVASLLVKLHAADRAEAVARGFERGLLKP